MKTKNGLIYLLLLLLLPAFAAYLNGCSCGDDDDEVGETEEDGGTSTGTPFKVEISPEAQTLPVGGSMQLVAKVYDKNNKIIAGAKITWSSTAEDVATVDESGLVNAIAIGSADITAKSGSVTSNKCVITVEEALGTPSSLTVEPSHTEILINQTVQFSAKVFDENGAEIPGIHVEWKLDGGPERGEITDTGLYTAPGVAPQDDVVVTASAPDYGLEGSAAVTVVASNPTPQITSIDPQAKNAGEADFTLTVTGSGFVGGSKLFFGGDELTPTVNSDTELTALIPAALIATSGTKQVQVYNPPPGGGQSNSIAFTINPEQNPLPTVNSVSPTGAIEGSPDTTITISGDHFVQGLQVFMENESTVERTELALVGTVSAQEVLAIVPAALLTTAGTTYNVVVNNPSPGGGEISGAVFTVTEAPPKPESPTLTTLNPSSVEAGSAAFGLTLQGTNFQQTATVEFDGNDLSPITFTSATEISVQVPANLVTTAKTVDVRVINPDPSGPSNRLSFKITPKPNPTPQITGLDPGRAIAGDAGFTLKVFGSSFINGAVVYFDGVARLTTVPATGGYVSAQIPADAIATQGDKAVYVANPSPSQNSNTLTFTVDAPNPAPTLTSITPNSANVGSNDVLVTFAGTNFLSGARAYFDGNELITGINNDHSASATFLSTLLTESGEFDVWIENPPPGGGASNHVKFTVTAGKPVLTTIFPTQALAATAFKLFCEGTGFASNSTVMIDGTGLDDTTYVSSTRLLSSVLATMPEILTAGTANIAVLNPPPGGGVSDPKSMDVLSPMPVVTSLSVSAAKEVTVAKVTITGTNFMQGAKVLFNNTEPTEATVTYVNPTSLEIDLAASSSVLSTPNSFNFVVRNPQPSESDSSPLKFSVYPAAQTDPIIAAITPTTVVAGASQTTIKLKGSGMKTGLTATFSGTAITNVSYSSTDQMLSLVIPATNLTTAGHFEIVVSDGGTNSNTAYFTVLPNNALPTAITVQPSTVNGNMQTDLKITVLATTGKFISGAKVLLDGAPLVTTFKSDTELEATVPKVCSWPGTRRISVRHAGPNGGTTAAVNLVFQ